MRNECAVICLNAVFCTVEAEITVLVKDVMCGELQQRNRLTCFLTIWSYTETVLFKAFNNLKITTDCGDSYVLILLGLTAAFGTVDHNILLSRLDQCGIKGTALDWFRSYLFSFSLGNSVSSSPSPPHIWSSPGVCFWSHYIFHAHAPFRLYFLENLTSFLRRWHPDLSSVKV